MEYFRPKRLPIGPPSIAPIMAPIGYIPTNNDQCRVVFIGTQILKNPSLLRHSVIKFFVLFTTPTPYPN
jgi:hypothetical protein